MEEAIRKFMDSMEAQERGGFKELHQVLGHLPVPTNKESQGMTHTEAVEGGFLPVMDEESRNNINQVNSCCTSMLWNTGSMYLYIPGMYQYILKFNVYHAGGLQLS